MACCGGKHLVVASLLIMSAIAVLDANPVPNSYNSMGYIRFKMGKRIQSSSQNNEGAATLLDQQDRSGEEGLGGNTGIGIVPNYLLGIKRMVLEEQKLQAKKKLIGQKVRSSGSEEGIGETGDTGTEPDDPDIGMGGYIHSRAGIQKAASRGAQQVEKRWVVENFKANRNGRSEEGGMEGTIGTGIDPDDLKQFRRVAQHLPQARTKDRRIEENTGIGIEPEDSSENWQLIPLFHEGWSDEDLGGDGGIVIDPIPPFRTLSEIKSHRTVLSEEEDGLGGNTGTGISPNDPVGGRSGEGELGGNSGTGIVPSDRLEGRSLEGGISGTGIDSDDPGTGRSEEGELGGNSGTGIVSFDRLEGRSEDGDLGGNSGIGIVPVNRLQGRSFVGGISGPGTGSSDPENSRSEEGGVGGNSGTGIVPFEHLEGRSVDEGISGTGIVPINRLKGRSFGGGISGTGTGSSDPEKSRSEEGGLGGNSGTGIIPDIRVNGRYQEKSLDDNGGIAIGHFPPVGEETEYPVHRFLL